MNRSVLLIFLVSLFGCESGKKKDEDAPPTEVAKKKSKSFQAVSLLGDTLYTPEYSPEQKSKLDSNLNVADKNWQNDPSEINTIWLGRRVAYTGRYRQAIEIFSEGLTRYPESYKLLRHRGHRYISIREFDKAINDFKKAADIMPKDRIEIEPDGIPNRMNTPLSSTQFNVWYHLGLAYYLKGDFEKAVRSYKECLKVSVNDDLQTATIDWLYMTYRRQGLMKEAEHQLKSIHENMAIIENDSYFKRLKLYKGNIPVDSVLTVSDDSADIDLALATQGYGVGNWYLYNADTTKAIEVFKKVIAGEHWSAFGYIAAEVDLARLSQ
ncbi:MAG: tetratricopeptide repeat protein [Bacteroidota bacterium]